MKNKMSVFPNKVVEDDGNALLVGGMDLWTHIYCLSIPAAIQAFPKSTAEDWAAIAELAANRAVENLDKTKKRGAK